MATANFFNFLSFLKKKKKKKSCNISVELHVYYSTKKYDDLITRLCLF